MLVTTIDALGHFRIITPQLEGIGDVGLARNEPVLLSTCLTIRVLSYITCQRTTIHFEVNLQKFGTLRVNSIAWSVEWSLSAGLTVNAKSMPH